MIRPSREVPAAGSIDWNGNGRIDPGVVTSDLNDDGSLGDLLSTPSQWNALVYNGGSIGSVATLEAAMEFAEDSFQPFPYIELTEEMDRLLAP